MTAPHPTDRATTLGPLTRDLIHSEWMTGKNTHEISRALGVPEAVVAEVVRAERERRVEVYTGRQER